MPVTDQLSLTFAALADPSRRAILTRLARGEATVNELAAPLDISLPAVSRHLKVLERAGLITRGRVGQTRPCRLEPQGLELAGHWLRGRREEWEAGMDRLEELLRTAGDLPN